MPNTARKDCLPNKSELRSVELKLLAVWLDEASCDGCRSGSRGTGFSRCGRGGSSCLRCGGGCCRRGSGDTSWSKYQPWGNSARRTSILAVIVVLVHTVSYITKINEDSRQQELALKIMAACPELVAGWVFLSSRLHESNSECQLLVRCWADSGAAIVVEMDRKHRVLFIRACTPDPNRLVPI